MLKAYALPEGSAYDVETVQAGVALPDGTQYDVGEALRDGGGVIVTDDDSIAHALDGFVSVEEIEVPSDAAPNYSAQTKDELRTELASRGLELPDDATKADYVAALETNDQEGA